MLVRLHKPPGVLTTAHDPAGRPTILDLLPRDPTWQQLSPVGRCAAAPRAAPHRRLSAQAAARRRLDINSEGAPPPSLPY